MRSPQILCTKSLEILSAKSWDGKPTYSLGSFGQKGVCQSYQVKKILLVSFEKHLILEEIASLSDRLQNQAAEGWHDTLELAQKVQQAQLTAIQHWLLAKYHSRTLPADIAYRCMMSPVFTCDAVRPFSCSYTMQAPEQEQQVGPNQCHLLVLQDSHNLQGC